MNFQNEMLADDEAMEINITPLIDIVFLLLIFFMVSATFDESQGIKVKLPTASSAPVKAPAKNISLSITQAGDIYISNNKIAENTLSDELARLISEGAAPTLILRADAKVPHGLVVKVMDVAKSSGVKKIAVATAPKP